MEFWAALFSGGKDSTYAFHLARQQGIPVERLVTVHPPEDAFMYHVPGTDLTALAAKSIGLPLIEIEAQEAGTSKDPGDATARGDAELAPLEAGLSELVDNGLTGVTVGAVESEFQHRRISEMADRLGVGVFDPLWHRDPVPVLNEMVEAGFEIVIVAVAAAGLDESWLGRTIDARAIEDLDRLREEYGLHPMGEGGEFETLVTDGPHMNRRLRFEATTEWDGIRGHLVFEDAWLE